MLQSLGRAPFAALVALSFVAPAFEAAALPTRATIVVDGDDSDWELVLVNPENTARDGDGSSLSCLVSSDLDCPVPAGSLDLAGFAWTFDDDELYLRLERQGGGDETALVYLDSDLDGLMESGEPVLVIPLSSALVDGNVTARFYLPVDGGGDPLLSPGGLADGWPLRGDFDAGELPVGVSRPVDAAGRVHELRVGRSILGLPSSPALGYHVSMATTLSPPGISDNMAGREGGAGNTSYRELELDGDQHSGGAPGTFAELVHEVHNASNVPARVRLEAVTELPLVVETWADLDGDGVAETWMAVDAEGDGDLGGVSDTLAPEGDGDADGLLDLGLLAPFERRSFLLRVSLPLDSAGMDSGLALRLVQVEEENAEATASDRVLAGAVTVLAPPDALGAPDHAIWLPFEVTRHAGSGAIDLWAKTDEDWPIELFEDALDTGLPEDAVPPVDSDGSGLPDLILSAGASRIAWLRVQVPGDAMLGMRDSALLRIFENAIPVADDRARLTVAPPVQLVPDHREEDGNALRGQTGEGVWFAHRLIHALEGDDPVALTFESDLGWEVSLHEDPDGDGRPYDAVALESPVLLQVTPNGGTRSLLVRVDIPEDVSLEDSTRVTVTATPNLAAGRSASAVDDAVASIVRTYEDDSYLVAVSRVAACSTVHAQASGLPPSTAGYRFTWRDPESMVLRVSDATTDALGNCADAWTPAPGESGDGYRVDIQELDAGTWLTLDSAPIGIDDLAEAGAPEVFDGPFHVSGRDLLAEVEVSNASELLPIDELELRWVVLAPDESGYLLSDGSFLPFTGAEWTHRDFFPLDPGASRRLSLRVDAVAYPGEGDYELRIELGSRCGETATFSSSSFGVIDDVDGDGLRRVIELSNGTDPEDADSDDDGLADGLDGLEDSDSDGLLDALDCDSDDDGLPDGLETGAWEPLPDTDVAAGCFVFDLWPVTTTDPDQADSDLGGVSDGLEDANGNGRVDAGETDPNDAADDPACNDEPAAEVEDFSLARLGGSLQLSWTLPELDDCSAVVLLSGESPIELSSDGVRRLDAVAEFQLETSADYWLVAVDSTLAGLGELGR